VSARVAFVTGAAAGIGAATAEALARAGYAVAVSDVDDDALGEVVEQVRAVTEQVIAVPADVRDAAAVRAAVDRTCSALGPPTAVFAAAGVMAVSPFLELSVDAWRRTLDINLTGTFTVLQTCAQVMTQAGSAGSMVAVASVAARGPRADAADYAASKAAVLSLVRSAAVALGPSGIRVNAICPGVIDTAMTRRNAERRAQREGGTPEQALAKLVGAVPLGRLAAPEEVASVALALLGDGFGYVTGQAVNVCGGLEFD
jgi:NAD(P)-dependent dehydrogenase (short-subunit alcohol dehydrogenase family)